MMETCGEEHGRMCERMQQCEGEICDQILPAIRRKLDAAVFYWVVGGIATLGMVGFGWVEARIAKVTDLDRSVAVMQVDVKYIKESVAELVKLHQREIRP